jgi:hypothetical protein
MTGNASHPRCSSSVRVWPLTLAPARSRLATAAAWLPVLAWLFPWLLPFTELPWPSYLRWPSPSMLESQWPCMQVEALLLLQRGHPQARDDGAAAGQGPGRLCRLQI